MKISVITPVLNRARTIEHTLRSVAAQTHYPVEHIVQDGGSTDGTADILRHWSGECRIQSASDNGLYDAINKGISRCQGDVVGVLGSDDFLSDQSVLSDISTAMTDSSVDGVYGDLDLISKSGRVLRHWRAGPFWRARLRRGWMPPHPTLYMRREVFDRFGCFDASYHVAGDYDAILRWIWTGHIRLAYLPRVLVKMRHGGVSTGSFSTILTKSREDYRALRHNNVGGLGTLMAKNLRKLGQFSALLQDRQH